VISFLGHVGYYKKFVKDFSKIATPLFDLLIKESEFNWILVCQNAFESLKESLIMTPVLKGLNWKLPFHIYTDALDTTIGAVLG